MVRSGGRFSIGGLNAFETAAFVLFFASAPVLPVVFGMWSELLSSEDSRQSLFLLPPHLALPLSAMLTALAFLVACLVKREKARIGSWVMLAAVVAYVVGCALAVLLGVGVMRSGLAEAVCGLAMGYGGAVMASVWLSGLRLPDVRSSLRAVWIGACALFANVAVLSLFERDAALAYLATEAVLSTVGCGLLFLRLRREAAPPAGAGIRWQDALGRCGAPMIGGFDRSETSPARTLMSIAACALVLLLCGADIGLLQETEWETDVTAACGLVAAAAMLPLLRIKSDQRLVCWVYSLFLPLLAFAAFALAAFFDGSSQRLAVMAGAFAFCTVFALATSATIVATAGRARSFGLPAASMVLVACCLACLLPHALGAAGLDAYRYLAVVALLAAAAVALVVAPDSRRLWRAGLDEVGATDADPFAKQESYVRRCEMLSQERGLTVREAEILVVLGRGHTSRFIAEELSVADSTVRSHRKNIYRKLGVTSREELFRLLDGGTQRSTVSDDSF